MRHLLFALGLCISLAILSSPVSAAQSTAAQSTAAHHTMLAKAKKTKSKFKPRKAPKHPARRANRAN